jgi:hypothetical protein
MSNIKNTHIQGNLTISANASNVVDHGAGILFTDFFQETTDNAGIKILNSNLNLYNTGRESSSIVLTNDLIETCELSINGSSNVNGNGVRSMTLLNNSGDSYLQSKGGVGIKVTENTGNVVIQSTTESINSNTAGLIVKGGISVNKSLIVDSEIRGSNGYHILHNTNSAQNVLEIRNTSSSGYSNINFKDSSDVQRLQIGYGNAGVITPYASQAYIQSSSSSLLLRSNNTDSILLKTDGSVELKNTNASTSFTTGAMTSPGGISISNTTDATSSSNGGGLSVAGGVSIAKKAFVGTDLSIGNAIQMYPVSVPPAPSTGVKYYIDSADNILKSIDSLGGVKTYNPLKNKGELLTHDGTSDFVLSPGSSGQILSVNPATSSGLSWIDNNGSSSSVTQKSNIFTMYVKDSPVYILQKTYASWYSYIYPLCLEGASSIFFSSKSVSSNKSHVYRMCTNKSISTDKTIDLLWDSYRSLSVSKTYDEGAGDYSHISNENFNYSSVSLSGTSWVSLGGDYISTTGAFYISTYSDYEGPCSTFVICKSDSTLNSGSLFIISSSPSVLETSLKFRWLSGSGIEMRKTSNNDDGSYNIINNFQNSISTTITLTNTLPTVLPRAFFCFYENKSFSMRVYSNIPDSPKAVFFMSKNSYLNSGAQTSSRSPGKTSMERLFLTWSPSSLLEIHKNGSNYDGTYNVDMVQIY